MNGFDLMIERYKKELIDAKKRSILKELEETTSQPYSESTAVLPANASLEVQNTETAETAQPKSHDSAEQTYETYEEGSEKSDAVFLSENTSERKKEAKDEEEPVSPESLGSLKVQVFVADRAYPVSSARVVVTEKSTGRVCFDGYTDTDGSIGKLLLPAPERSSSQTPQEKPPYAQYDIVVSHPGFQSRKYLGVPVFAGVESIQNIQLIPSGLNEDENNDVTESEPEILLKKRGERNA